MKQANPKRINFSNITAKTNTFFAKLMEECEDDCSDRISQQPKDL